MKYDWRDQTGEKPARKFAVFPLLLAVAAFLIVLGYLAFGSSLSRP